MHDIDFSKLNKKQYNEKDQQIIDGWQNRAIKLAEQENFRFHPVTIKLSQTCREEIARIEHVLTSQEDMTEQERRALFREKKTHEFYLNLFIRDGSQELKVIAKSVEQEL